jgi:hypothetical protein
MIQAVGTILMVAVAWGLFFGVGVFAESHFKGTGFASRFPERDITYSAAQLYAFASDRAELATFYVFPILFPLDLFVMILIAGSSALASILWAKYINLPIGLVWLVVRFPAVYLAFERIRCLRSCCCIRRPSTTMWYRS